MSQTRDRLEYDRNEGRRWLGTASAPPQTNPEAFATNFRTLTPALYDFLDRLSGRDEAAIALTRQVASQAAMSAASADQWPSARAWLFARAYAALPADTSAADAEPAPYIVPDLSMLPPVAPEDGLDDMTRAVWRAISALPVEQHALLHLHTREAMVGGEAASVLGITEREATDRLRRLTPAVEAASRALFLIRFGRPRDPDLDALLSRLNITRLTPEARATIEEYAERSPAAQRMLAAVPPPLTVYAALRPIPPPAGIADESIAGALPWLPLVTEATAAIDMPTTALPEEPSPAPATDAPTAVTPTADSWEYDQPPPDEAPYGTRALDIPVRQRLVQEEAIYSPPRPANRAMGPLALLGLLGGALVVVVGALVLFLVRGDSGANVSVTATVGGTPTATSVPTALSPALATSTALAALLGTPTALPTATTAPLPPSTASAGSVTAPTTEPTTVGTPTPLGTAPASSPATTPANTPISTPINTPVPKVTPIPQESPTPRVTPVPTDTPAPTKPPPTATPATPAKPTATPAGPTATAGAGGTITLDKASVNLGAAGTSGAVTLSNAGPSPVTFTAKSNIPSLSVAPASGSVPANGSLPTTVTVNRAGLTPGTYSGTVTFTTPGGSFSAVTVTFTV